MAQDSKSTEKQSKADLLEALFPGRVVKVDSDRGITAIVYPPGIMHVREFSRDLVSAMMTTVQMIASPRNADRQKLTAIITQMVPFITSNMIDLVCACVRVECPQVPGITVKDLPHWLVASIIEAWVVESFGSEEKLRPWKAAIERTVSQVTGKPFSISETFSRLSSPQATPGQTSSSDGSQASRTAAGA